MVRGQYHRDGARMSIIEDYEDIKDKMNYLIWQRSQEKKWALLVKTEKEIMERTKSPPREPLWIRLEWGK